jgi:hypothetical protein
MAASRFATSHSPTGWPTCAPFGGEQSPVLVIQSQCDRPEDERDPPLPPGALDGFGYKNVLHYSAKGDGTRARGHAALEETLRDSKRSYPTNPAFGK